ncbi:MAG TPA: retropepsin-like aspartic protease [Chthoniobacterales bacterium]
MAARAMTEVPLTMRGDYAVVPVSVAGAETPLLFILDTGAGGSVVSPATRAMLPIDPSESRFDTIVGAGGKSEMESVPLASLRVGEFTVEGLRAVVIDLADFKRSADEPYAGILGQDFLKRFDVEIDLPANRMRLHRRGNGNAPQLGFNAGPPLRNVSTSEDIGWLAFDATVEGKPVRALLDSGAPRTIVNWDAARAAGLSETSERVRKRERPTGGLGPARAPTFDFDATDLTVGSVAFGATPLRIANLQVFDLIGMGGKPGMLAGLDLLRRCAIFISYEDRTVRMCSRAEARATQ